MSGFDYRIGYTDDDRIFFKYQAPSQDGTPLDATLMMSPKEAAMIAEHLAEAVLALKKKGRIITID